MKKSWDYFDQFYSNILKPEYKIIWKPEEWIIQWNTNYQKLSHKETENLNKPITAEGKGGGLKKKFSNSYPSQKHQVQMVLQECSPKV